MSEPKKHPFITEQIVPNKKNKRKKLFYSLGSAALYAVVFGIVGSLTFALFLPYFEAAFGGSRQNAVSFTDAETPTPSATPTPSPSAAPEPEPIEVEFPEMGIQQVQEFYSLLSNSAEQFNRSVVTVSGVLQGVDWFDNPSELEAATCGLIIAKTDKSLFLLSAFDHIAEASSIRVAFSNKTIAEAQLSGYDKETNLAVLSIALADLPSSLSKSLSPVKLGDSYYAQPGTPVLALGNPNGMVYSMDFGLVSSDTIDRYITDNKLELFHTSMVAATKGEGAIVSLDGQILGLITHSQEKESEFCTAIGITRLKPLIEKLVNNESHACLGIIANDISTEYKESISVTNGIYISSVNNNSPALDAGLKSGDVILKIDDYEISSVAMFNNLITKHQPKDSVTLSIVRTSKAENQNMEVTVTLGKR